MQGHRGGVGRARQRAAEVGKDQDEAAGKGQRQKGGKQAGVMSAWADAAKRRRTEG